MNLHTAPGTVVQIQLSSIGVSTKAKEVLVYVLAKVNNRSYRKDDTGVVEVYSKDSMKEFVYIHNYKDDWSYNSDNLWIPIGMNRILYGRYIGPKLTGHRFAKMKVIGYR